MKNFFKSACFLIFYVVFQMILMSVSSIFLAKANGIKTQADLVNIVDNNTLMLTIISNLLSILALFIFFLVRRKNFINEINAKKVRIKEFILPSLISFSCAMAFAIITYNINFNNAEKAAQSVNYYSSIIPHLGIVIQIVAILIIAPITEEIVFRGLILTRLQRSFSNTAAVIISGLLFGLIHAMAGGIVLVLGASVMGIVLGIICVKTKSLLPAIIAHMAANLPDFILEALPRMPKNIQYISASTCMIIFIILISLYIKKENKCCSNTYRI